MRWSALSLRHQQENAFAALARQCRDMDAAARLHSQISRSGLLDCSTFLGNLVVQMYGNCCGMDSARAAFDRISARNVFSWNILLAAYARNGNFVLTLRLFLEMVIEGEVLPDGFTYATAIRACSSAQGRGLAVLGMEIHACVIETGRESDVYVGTALITMYGKLFMLDHSRESFDVIVEKDVASWNALLTAYAQTGHLGCKKAISCFFHLDLEGVKPDFFTFVELVSACTQLEDLSQGRVIHSRILALGFENAVSIHNALVYMYAKCGCIESSQAVFDQIIEKDVVAWTAMITAFTTTGQIHQAMELFLVMDLEGVQPSVPTFAIILSACSSVAQVRQIHTCIVDCRFDSDVVACTALINAYSSFLCLEESRRVFDDLPVHDTVAWNSILAACVENGNDRRFREAAHEMDHEGAKPNAQTFIIRIEACSRLGSLDLKDARNIHSLVIHCGYHRHNEILTGLITMFSKCGSLDDARRAFESHGERNVVTWTAMIAAYAQKGYLALGLELFQTMEAEGILPDTAALASGISSCGSLEELRAMHQRVSSDNPSDSARLTLGTALVAMYGSFGRIELAAAAFASIPAKDAVAFAAMSAALVENECYEEAIELLEEIEAHSLQPSPATIVNAVNSCTCLGELVAGRAIHRKLEGLHDVIFPAVVAALLNLYGRCGSLAEASALFNASHKRTVASWNAMIAAYAQHGHLPESLDLVHQMQLHGSLPDKFTYTEILQACSHSGTRNLGWSYFVRMGMDHGLIPAIEHYVCVVDLLGRIGQLELAERVVKGLPYEPDVAAWNSLLGSCKIQGDMPRAQDTVGAVLKLQAESAAPYVLLANLYAAARRWEDVAMVRKAMADRGIRKPTGRSFQCV